MTGIEAKQLLMQAMGPLALLAIALELLYGLFWCTHVVHHSSEHMNLTPSVRRSAFTLFAGASWITYLPLILVGFDPGWMMFVLHTQGIPKLHWLVEYIMCTPSHHRAHHARNPRYIYRNFGGTFIIFDRLFGTFAEEHADEPPEWQRPQQALDQQPQ